MKYQKIIFFVLIAVSFLNGFSQNKSQPIKPKAPVPERDSIVSPVTETILSDSLAMLVFLKFKPYKKSVHASYYNDKFVGKRTASGKKFDNNKYTAAHRKFPFGTKIRITNIQNGKSVVVEVIDRGPFTRGREVDMTKKAFMEIADGDTGGGMIVNIEVEKGYRPQ